jgi:hypothetical protein
MNYYTRSFFTIAFLIGSLKPSLAFSQETSANSPITYSGFFDAYYIKNIAVPVTLANKIRVFDPSDNEFNLALGEIDILKKAEPVGFRIDIGTGRVAALSLTGLIQQAFVTVVVPVGGGLTIDVGQFVTHMGYEVIESKDNWNYSRSILFGWAIPFYHTGARISYPVLSNLTATVSVLNGWNSTTDNNKNKTLGFMFNYAMLPSTNITLCGISGVEQSEPSISGKRNVFNLIVTHSLTDDLSLAIDADYGEERIPAGLATWKGGAVYAKYSIDTKSDAAVRFEIYNDAGNSAPTSTGSPQKLTEVTATYEYRPVENLIVRGEIRNDMSDINYFDNTKASNSKSQLTFLVGAIVTF